MDSIQPSSARPPILTFVLFALALLAVVAAVRPSGGSGERVVAVQDVRTAAETESLVSLLEAEAASQADRIRVLEEQLAIAQQASIETQERVANQREIILKYQAAEERMDGVDDGLVRWRIGYAIGGGTSLEAFENVILPCESGGEIDPDMAVGFTDDWGRAQINRPTWKSTFEELTGGATFEDWITDPILNGYMAAVVEERQTNGLGAWTCWRRR